MLISHLVINSLFFGFSGLLIISALLVITLSNPVKSVLSLVVCFFAATGLWLLLSAEFLALILILVYVGAVMTLFLFVVMTLNINNNNQSHSHSQYLKIYLPVGLLIAAVLTALLIFALYHSGYFNINSNTLDINNNINNTSELAKVLYTHYALPFEIAAVILLVAMIAAISLTLGAPVLNKKQQNIDQQIKVKKQDRIRLVK